MATTIKGITYSGLNVGDTVTLFCRKSSESVANESSPHTRASESDPSYKTWYISVEYDVEYIYSIRLVKADGTISWPVSGAKFTEKSPTPSPSFSISAGSTTATASIGGLTSGVSVIFRVSQIHSGAGGIIIGEESGIASGSTISLAVSGLTANTNYTGTVLVGGTSIGEVSFTTLESSGEPTYTISDVTQSSVTLIVSNLDIGDEVKCAVYSKAGVEIGSDSETASGGDVSLYVGSLSSNTEYTVTVIIVNKSKSLGTQSFATTGTATGDDPYIFNSGSSSDGTEIFVVVYNTLSLSFATITVNGFTVGTYTCDDGSTTFTIASEPNSTYDVVIVIKGITLTATISTVVDSGEFKWKTPIKKGAKIPTWQNPANGASFIAPVTADEWNRLVDLVNTKCGTFIDHVGSGAKMSAKPGGNIRQVADALDVAVDSGWTITAQFFLDLQDAINNM